MERLTVDQPVPASSSVINVAEAAVKTRGWGVFEHHGGIASLPYITLIEVFGEDEEHDAKTRADDLNDTAGEVLHEVADDPDTAIWSSTRYSAARVVLQGVSFFARATYSSPYEQA